MIPEVVERKIDKSNSCIEVTLRYESYDFDSRIKVAPDSNGITIRVYLDKPLPDELKGKAGFNFEFLPASYFEKTYLVDGKPGIFPLYPSSNTVLQPISEKFRSLQDIQPSMTEGKANLLFQNLLLKGKHSF